MWQRACSFFEAELCPLWSGRDEPCPRSEKESLQHYRWLFQQLLLLLRVPWCHDVVEAQGLFLVPLRLFA